MFNRDYQWWDYHSDQPYKLPVPDKPRMGWKNLREYLHILATTIGLSPLILLRYLSLRPIKVDTDPNSFVGLGISPDPEHQSEVVEMVDELGVQELLVRIPAWEAEYIDNYVRFLELFKHKRFLICILQNHQSLADPDQWQQQLHTIFDQCQPYAKHFQIGNAINRSKWGCKHSGEYLSLLEHAEIVSEHYPAIELLGASVIDFEPMVWLRTLINFHRYYLDGAAAQLYVNRRGSPFNAQYGIFDLERKLKLFYSILSQSNRCDKKLWITETNWPLLDTKPYTPNSGHPRSTVDETTQAKYLKQYYQIAWHTGWVEKVYWWQLIAPGYGLVDHRGAKLRKHPSFHAFKEVVQGDVLTTKELVPY